jgi:hypothetical protein
VSLACSLPLQLTSTTARRPPPSRSLVRGRQVYSAKQPLGITLEQHGEWVAIKEVKGGKGVQEGAGGEGAAGAAGAAGAVLGSGSITAGCVITAVNGKSVVMRPYREVQRALKSWAPPLTLHFRRAPAKRGILTKQARGKPTGNWRKRLFVLEGGRLHYFTPNTKATTVEGWHTPKGEARGEYLLFGAAVTVKAGQRRPFCFKLVSAMGQLVLQGDSHQEVLEWCAALYHAIAVQNGGAEYLYALAPEFVSVQRLGVAGAGGS